MISVKVLHSTRENGRKIFTDNRIFCIVLLLCAVCTNEEDVHIIIMCQKVITLIGEKPLLQCTAYLTGMRSSSQRNPGTGLRTPIVLNFMHRN